MSALANFPALPAPPMHSFRLHVPVVLLWLLLLPFAPLLLVALLIVCAVFGANPFRATAALVRLIASLKGIHIEAQSRDVSIAINLF
jgi:hypothetical protein